MAVESLSREAVVLASISSRTLVAQDSTGLICRDPLLHEVVCPFGGKYRLQTGRARHDSFQSPPPYPSNCGPAYPYIAVFTSDCAQPSCGATSPLSRWL